MTQREMSYDMDNLKKIFHERITETSTKCLSQKKKKMFSLTEVQFTPKCTAACHLASRYGDTAKQAGHTV